MRPSSHEHRRGTLLVCVLVCLGIATSIMLSAIQTSLRERRQLTRELQMEQTRWLVDAGIMRGIERLRADRRYEGETWEVSPALCKESVAKIVITRTSEGDEGTTRLHITAMIRGPEPNSPLTQHSKLVVVEDELTDE
jgi:type II secretory pathway component PulK